MGEKVWNGLIDFEKIPNKMISGLESSEVESLIRSCEDNHLYPEVPENLNPRKSV